MAQGRRVGGLPAGAGPGAGPTGMTGSQMIKLSFLRGNLSPCSGGKGWGWHQTPDSAVLGLAVCTAGSAQPHSLLGGPEGRLAAIGPAGVTLAEGPVHLGPRPGPVPRAYSGSYAGDGGGERGMRQSRKCIGCSSDHHVEMDKQHLPARPTWEAAGFIRPAFVRSLRPVARQARAEGPRHFWLAPLSFQSPGKPGDTDLSTSSWPAPHSSLGFLHMLEGSSGLRTKYTDMLDGTRY